MSSFISESASNFYKLRPNEAHEKWKIIAYHSKISQRKSEREFRTENYRETNIKVQSTLNHLFRY